MATTAVNERLILACKSLIVSLLPDTDLFPDLATTSVVDQIVENVKPIGFPAILVTIEGVLERYEARDTETYDAVTRPVVIAIVDSNDQDYVEPRGKYLLWRQSLIRAFRKTLSLSAIRDTVPEAVKCDVDPKVVVDLALPNYQFYKSGFTLNYRCIEPRGLPSQA